MDRNNVLGGVGESEVDIWLENQNLPFYFWTASFYPTEHSYIYEDNDGILVRSSCNPWYFPTDMIDRLNMGKSIIYIDKADWVENSAKKHIFKLIEKKEVLLQNGSIEKIEPLCMAIVRCEVDEFISKPFSKEQCDLFDIIINL